jgi:hypothetical protein
VHASCTLKPRLNPKQSTAERETDLQKMQQNIEEVNSQASSREAGLQVIIQQLRSHLEKAHVSLAFLVLIMCSSSSCVCVYLCARTETHTRTHASVCIRAFT